MKRMVSSLALALALLPSSTPATAQDNFFIWSDEAALALANCMYFVNNPTVTLEIIADSLAQSAYDEELRFTSIRRADRLQQPYPSKRLVVTWEAGAGPTGDMTLTDQALAASNTHYVQCLFGVQGQPVADFDARLTDVLERAARVYPAGGAWVSVPPGPSLSATWRRIGTHVVGGRSYPIKIEVSRFSLGGAIVVRRDQPLDMPSR